MNYIVRAAGTTPPLDAQWADPIWEQAETLEIQHFRPESSDHRPHTSARLLHDARGIYCIFRVQDRYVRCLRTQYHDPVWKDSCVEFFAQPRPDRGYFNFEFNCGAAFLCCHITNPERTPDGFKEFVKVPANLGRMIQARSSLAQRIDPEITEPVVWTLRFFIPFALFEHYLGPLGVVTGQVWRGNFFKCAEDNSHPHWASWSPVDEFNFHRPNCFGTIQFT
jgi:Carbohydrate-binding family 9